MKVLVTGGAGYIGSMTCVQLLAAGVTPVILDSLVNAKSAVIDRIEQVAGRRPVFVRGDIRDRSLLERVFEQYRPEAVIHFAGLKAVGESVHLPLTYYENNVLGTLALLDAMRNASVFTMIFSSSATVYGQAQCMPLTEDAPTSATNPYGRTKLVVEWILADAAAADQRWSMTALRYFNPVGAHPSGTIGEDPQGAPSNLMPFIAQVAVGRRERLRIFGNDYLTPDGTGVRDFIHVVDLAEGHLAALEHGRRRTGMHVFNLGTGLGHSVLELLTAFGRACGRELPYEVAPRRDGDVASSWADPALAEAVLGWRATRGLDAMCADTWRWQSSNPMGYEG